MRICICGAGIAGLTLAWWLGRDGHDVVVIERAPALRSEGYMLDFFGSGWDVAERMQLLARLEAIHYPIPNLEFVQPDGSIRVTIPYPRLRKLFDNRHFNFMRGDLEHALYEALPDPSVVRFGVSVDGFADGVVEFSEGASERFDLLVGADGIHSRVREFVRPGRDPLRFLGFYSAAYVIEDAPAQLRDIAAFRTLTLPGRQVAIYPIRGDKLATFFVYDASMHGGGDDQASPARTLRRVFGDAGWIAPMLLERLPTDRDIYFDTVSQVVLDRWHADRVVLVGDACGAVSLLAGQGASMAMGGAWALAKALREQSTLAAAFEAYERHIRPAIEKKQEAGRNMAAWFVPKSQWRINARDTALNLSTKQGLSWLLGRFIAGDSVVGSS